MKCLTFVLVDWLTEENTDVRASGEHCIILENQKIDPTPDNSRRMAKRIDSSSFAGHAGSETDLNLHFSTEAVSLSFYFFHGNFVYRCISAPVMANVCFAID